MKEITSFILFLLPLYVVRSTNTDEAICNIFRYDYNLDKEAEGWLKFHKVPATFKSAFQRCKAEGAVLASPLTVKLREAMVNTQEGKDICGLFTGVHATLSKGDFTSVEGVPLSKMPVEWAPYEPGGYESNDDCTILLQNGTLAGIQCSDSYPYMCFKKYSLGSNAFGSACGTSDKEYVYEDRTGSCYKFHRVARTWRQAAMTCMAEGGYLAIINSDTEVQVIKEIFANILPKSITSSFNYIAAIGIYDWGERGVWYTVHGETLQEAGYSTFSSGEPNNNTAHDGGSFCGGVFRNGLLDDIWCNEVNFPFICEMEPDDSLMHKSCLFAPRRTLWLS